MQHRYGELRPRAEYPCPVPQMGKVFHTQRLTHVSPTDLVLLYNVFTYLSHLIYQKFVMLQAAFTVLEDSEPSSLSRCFHLILL